jgi:hypothetical protein
VVTKERTMVKNASVAWLLFLWPASVLADEVVLRGGGKVTGVIVERTADAIVLETAPGRVSIPLGRVASVRATGSDLATYTERAAKLAAQDAAGWLALARWAADRDLRTQSREAYERVLALDPGNLEANQAQGRVEQDGRWMSEEEANRANGLVPFEGAWVTPAEREGIRRDRANESAEALAVREAEARAREAEARAREAEARARQAESEGQAAETSYGGGGIPLWPYVYGPAIVPPIVPFPPHKPTAPPPTTQPPETKPPATKFGGDSPSSPNSAPRRDGAIAPDSPHRRP